jgi:hypothetical protein
MDAPKKGFEGNLIQLQITINKKKAASFTAFFERIIQIILI